MSSRVTSAVKAQECHQPQYDVERTNQCQSLLPQDIFIDGEQPLFESRSLLWPLLTRPVIYLIVGLIILFFMDRLPPDSITTFLGLPSYETAIRTIIKWTGVAIIVIGALGIIIRWLHWRFTIYTATNRRILRQTGIMAKSYIDCSFSKIQTLHMRIPLLGRIFGFGTIKLATSGTVSTEIQWENLKNPKYAYRRLNEIIENYRQTSL